MRRPIHRNFFAFPLQAALFVVSIALLLASRCGASANTDPRAARFDDVASHYARCGYFQGAILVAEHGQIVYAKGFGEANIAAHTPNTTQTRFGIASITKQFTAALVFLQAAKGTLRLEGTVADYLPWYRKDTGRRITVEQLLHHTSGLPPDYNDPEPCDPSGVPLNYEPGDFAKNFCQRNLVAEPGTQWAYSNGGYVLLGLILEQVTGKPFEQLLHEQLLDPLGMKATGLDHNDLAQLGGALGYTRRAGPRYTPGPYIDRGHIFSAGAMYSTAEDLLRWNAALSSTNFFTAEIQHAMFTPGLSDWAGGWFVTTIPKSRPGAGNHLAEMRGDMPGNFFTLVLRYPDQDAVIIVLRNAYGSTEHLEDNLQAVLFGQSPRLPTRSPKDLLAHAAYVGWQWLAAHWLLGSTSLLLLIAAALAKRLRGRFLSAAISPPVQ